MAENTNGWQQPEEKFPETELEDSFAEYFSEEVKGSKKAKGPDILAVAEGDDTGFVITEVLPMNEPAEVEHQEEEAPAQEESAGAQEEISEHEDQEEPENSETEEEVVVVDLAPEGAKNEKKPLFAKAKSIISAKRKHQYVATVGAVLIALAVIGAIALCSVLVTLGARVLDNTNQKEAFAWKIYPVLMLDPATFDDPSQLDEVFVLKTALWANLLENRLKYSYNEQGMLLVPASDLDVAAKSLYGESIVLKHQTFSEGYEFFYLYDEETNTYSVPISGQAASYVPEVVEIARDGSLYTLIVGYVAPTTLWNVTEDGSDATAPDKYMYYDLEKVDGGNYIIKSVRSIPEDELPDDLEVSPMKGLNETQYFDYDEIYQDYLQEELESAEGAEDESAEGTESEASEETSSAEG